MSFELFQKLIEMTKEYIIKNKISTLEILFHGGEPLLWGLEKYKKALKEIFNALNNQNLFLKVKIQTNATLLNKKWVSLFSKYHTYVSSSLDGPKEIHDLLRVDYEGKGTHTKVLKNLRMLKKHKKQSEQLLLLQDITLTGQKIYIISLKKKELDYNLVLLFIQETP